MAIFAKYMMYLGGYGYAVRDALLTYWYCSSGL